MEINAGLTTDNLFIIYGKDDKEPIITIDLSNITLNAQFLITDEDRIKIGKATLNEFVELVKDKTSKVNIETTQKEILDGSLEETN